MRGVQGGDPRLQRESVGQYKRFLECYEADPCFAEAFVSFPEATLKEHGIAIDHRLLQPIWDESLDETVTESGVDHPLLDLRRQFIEILRDSPYVERLRASVIRSERYRAWRSRQAQRTVGLSPRHHSDKMIHIPLAFELSRGCSVGCPFCAFSPPPLDGLFEYTEVNARLWRRILEVTKEIFGEFAGTSLCYFATEPFDHPHYESFCIDFCEVYGMFPRTTTSQFNKDPGRTRRLLDLMGRMDRVCCSFSISSLQSLRDLHAEFSADELIEVPLSLNNRESTSRYGDSGRVRKWSPKLRLGQVFDVGSVSCLSGFLVNMVDRSVQLVTPCNPSDEHPFGYVMYEKATFSTAADFGAQLERMMDANMLLVWPVNRPLHFRVDLDFRGLGDGFELWNRFQTKRFTGDVYLRKLGELIHRRSMSIQEISAEMGRYFISAEFVADAVQTLFDAGMLEEAPAGR